MGWGLKFFDRSGQECVLIDTLAIGVAEKAPGAPVDIIEAAPLLRLVPIQRLRAYLSRSALPATRWDAMTLEHVLRLIEAGRLRLYRRQVEAVMLDTPTPEVIQAANRPKKKVKLTWIEIHLHLPDGKPVADEPYVLELDGKEVPGRTNANGWARHDNIPAGDWTIRFPERDQESWSHQGACSHATGAE